MENGGKRDLHRKTGLPVKHTKTGKMYQMTIKNSKWPQNILYGLKIDQMTIKYATSSTEKTSKIYQKLNVWFEKIPSGNPAEKQKLSEAPMSEN
jgi:hypothetical protein